MTYQNLEALAQSLGCYFHQDWIDEFDSDEAAFKVIVDSQPK